MVLFLALTAAVAIVAWREYLAQKEAVEREVQNQLLTIADLKVTELSQWHARLLQKLRILSADNIMTPALERLAEGQATPKERAQTQEWIDTWCRQVHFWGARFVDLHGDTLVRTGEDLGGGVPFRQIINELLAKDDIVSSDLHTDRPQGPIHLGLGIPLRRHPGSRPFGLLLAGVDPADYLYPLLSRWPGRSRSAEIMLVRREDDGVLVLNDLRHERNAALRLHLPVGYGGLLEAASAASPLLEGNDYRGVPVFSAVRAVPGTSWILVAKMDADEVRAPIRHRSIVLAVAALSLILSAGAGAFLLWRRQQWHFYRTRREADRERQDLVGHYDYLTRFANDIILLADDSAKIVEANDRAVGTYGYSREELLNMSIRQLRHPSAAAGFEREWRESGERGSLVFETAHQDRAGRAIPVEVSVRHIDVEGQRFRQSIVRDITERKTLHEKMRHTLDTLSAILDASPAAIMALDRECNVTAWNKAAEQLFGWTAEEAIGRYPLDVPEENKERANRIHERSLSGEVISGQRGEAQCKDGRRIIVSISSAALHDSEGRCSGVVSNLLDITEQVRAEEALRDSELRFRTVFEQAAIGMNLVSRDRRFYRVNQKFCEITGYSREELSRLRVCDITHPDDCAADNERFELWLKGALETAAVDKRYIRKDGSVVWVHLTTSLIRSASGEPLYFVGMVEDISGRLRAEEALRQSEERFRSVVENAPEGIIVERELQILYANSAAAKMFGAKSAEELEGRKTLDLISPEDWARVRALATEVSHGRRVFPVEMTHVRPGGYKVEVEASAVPILYDQQPASLVFFRDISERRRADAEKTRLEEQLRQAQKMESLGRLAGGVAHDFNNHLTVIAGYCDMLLSRFGADEPMREDVEQIRAAGERAGALTQQLLMFSRKQIAEQVCVNLNVAAAESEKMLRRLIGENIEITLNLGPDLALVLGDRGQIGQILLNLVVNARDAMPDGGKLVIATANTYLDDDAASQFKDLASGPYVMLSVRDTGAGISPETLEHIFETFFTTKGLGIGTGLGLSTVYGIVQHWGGGIRVFSRQGEGTEFQILLPQVARVTEELPQPAPEADIPCGTETVLVVEDQAEVRRLALRVLKRSGYRLLEATNGPEALELSRNYHGKIHLLITDVIMPGMTGRELADRLRQERPGIRSLYMSGYTDDVIGREGVIDPGTAYLRKPFTPAQLCLKTREVLGQSKALGRILVIDDDESVRGLLEQILADAGYDVAGAGDGKSGMRLIEEGTFQLVLTDLIMPDQEGIETIRMLRRGHPEIRVIAMSGALDQIYLRTAAMLGASATLRKPVGTEALLRTVREVLG